MSSLWDSESYSSQQNTEQNTNTQNNSTTETTPSNSEQLEQQSSKKPYKALEDGHIEFETGCIGPFVGELQGVPRNQLIAESLSQLKSGDLENTNILPEGGGVRIHIGSISFLLTPDDILAQSGLNDPIFDSAYGISQNHHTDANPSDQKWIVAIDLLKKLGATVPEKSLNQSRGELAVRQGRLSYMEGQALHGDGSWETYGTNQGPLITPIKEANRASGSDNYEWCGMYVGNAYKKAGIRDEIIKSLVFWSGYRLYSFFTKGVDVNNRKIGDFWETHNYTKLNFSNADTRKEALDEFSPQPGDILLFRSDYSHVAMVDSYDPATGIIEALEGNSGNRVQATSFGTGYDQITFIGRFNDSDYGSSVDNNLLKQKTPNVEHDDKRSGITS
jgi:hypothetical protein